MPFPEPVRTEVDGIPVWFSDVGGPCLGGLVFRVGRIDEQLSTSGLTHIVEHLTLGPLIPRRIDMNGRVSQLETTFLAAGTQEEVESFLTAVCEHLYTLDLGRLEVEQRILQTEDRQRSGSTGGSLSYFFGADGVGLVDWPELGIASVEPEAIDAWRDRFFVGSQAAVYLTREPSPGFTLPLPPGEPQPLPEPARVPFHTGARHRHVPAPLVGLSFVGPRTMPLYVAAHLARMRLFDVVRVDRGLSYSVGLEHDRVSVSNEIFHLYIDVADERDRESVDTFIETVETVLDAGIPASTVAQVSRAMMPWEATDPSRPAREAFRMAQGELIGHRASSWDELREQVDALTGETIAASFAEALEDGLLIVPEGQEVEGRFSEHPDEPPVHNTVGRLYVRWDGSMHEFLVDARGITSSFGFETTTTIMFEDCVLAAFTPAGTMWIVDRWGTSLVLELNQLRRGRALAADIRGRVPDRIVDLRSDVIGWFELQDIIETHDRSHVSAMWAEFEILANIRQEGERILRVAFAELLGDRGVLALTDRRVIHICARRVDRPILEIEERVTAARTSVALWGRRLQLRLEGGRRVVFERVRPQGAAAEFETMLAIAALDGDEDDEAYDAE